MMHLQFRKVRFLRKIDRTKVFLALLNAKKTSPTEFFEQTDGSPQYSLRWCAQSGSSFVQKATPF